MVDGPICVTCRRILPHERLRADQGGESGDGYFCGERCGWQFAVNVMDKVRAGKLTYPFPLEVNDGE